MSVSIHYVLNNKTSRLHVSFKWKIEAIICLCLPCLLLHTHDHGNHEGGKEGGEKEQQLMGSTLKVCSIYFDGNLKSLKINFLPFVPLYLHSIVDGWADIAKIFEEIIGVRSGKEGVVHGRWKLLIKIVLPFYSSANITIIYLFPKLFIHC